MLPALSDFIKGALSPDLLKALQLLGPGTVWQAAVAVMLVLLFAYLLISLSSRTLAIFTGEA
jgi:hypothetical protein